MLHANIFCDRFIVRKILIILKTIQVLFHSRHMHTWTRGVWRQKRMNAIAEFETFFS